MAVGLEKGLEDAWNKIGSNIDYPPTKSQKKKYFGRNLIDNFCNEFEKKSWNLPFYAKISFHVLLGQLPSIKNMSMNIYGNSEDLRIHMLLLQESGSGKSGGFSFTSKVANEITPPINFVASGDLTNASLVGSIEQRENGTKIERHGLLSPRDESKGGNVDILGSSEASQIIDTRNDYFQKNAITNLQKAMNRIGSSDNIVRRDLMTGTVKYNTDASMYFTTYPPERLMDTITRTGLLQRMVVIHNQIGLSDKMKASMRHLEGLRNDGIEIEIDDIVDAMGIINKVYSDVNKLKLTDEGYDVLKDTIKNQLYKPLNNGIKPTARRELRKFTTRYQNNLFKLAWHSAIARLSKKVELRDAMYARNLMMPIWHNLITFLEDEYIADKGTEHKFRIEKNKFIRGYQELMGSPYVSNSGWIYQKHFLQEMSREGDYLPYDTKWNVSHNTVYKKWKEHETMFEQKKTKTGKKVVKLKQEYLENA